MENSENLPQNRFKELDKLEREEHLDKTAGINSNPVIAPLLATPYNAAFTLPCGGTGFPAAALFHDYNVEKEDKKRD